MRFATTKLEAFTRGSLARRDTEISSIGRSLFDTLSLLRVSVLGWTQTWESAPGGAPPRLSRDQTVIGIFGPHGRAWVPVVRAPPREPLGAYNPGAIRATKDSLSHCSPRAGARRAHEETHIGGAGDGGG